MEPIQWCHSHNAKVTFRHPNGVEVKVPGIHMIYAYCLEDAIKAIEEMLVARGWTFEHGCLVKEVYSAHNT